MMVKPSSLNPYMQITMLVKQLTFVLKHKSGEAQYSAGNHRD